MATDYAEFLRQLKKPKAETYNAELRDVNAETDTVQGQMKGLLNEDSDYMKKARTEGMQYANSRGLLNSSIGARSMYAAALDAALPIATQDASIYMTQGLANQDATNTARQFNTGSKNAANLAHSQNRATILSQGLQNAGALNVQNAADAAADKRNLDDIEYKKWKTEEDNKSPEKIAKLNADTEIELKKMGIDYDTWATKFDGEVRQILNNAKIAAQDRQAFTTWYGTNKNSFMTRLNNILTNPNYENEADRQTDAQNEIDSWASDVMLQGTLYGLDLEVSSDGSVYIRANTNAGDSTPEETSPESITTGLGNNYNLNDVKTWATGLINNSDSQQVYDALKEEGVSAAEFDTIMGYEAGTTAGWITEQGLSPL